VNKQRTRVWYGFGHTKGSHPAHVGPSKQEIRIVVTMEGLLRLGAGGIPGMGQVGTYNTCLELCCVNKVLTDRVWNSAPFGIKH